MFTSPLRDIPEVAPWITTMIENGYAAFLIGTDLNRWRYPLTTYSNARFPLRLWLVVRVRKGIDKELARRKLHEGQQQAQLGLGPYFAVTGFEHVVWGASRQTRGLRNVLTRQSLISVPGSKFLRDSDATWHETETNENGVQLVCASTGTAGTVPLTELCPTQWQDQCQPRRIGWHYGVGGGCNRSTPGAVLEEMRVDKYRPVFRCRRSIHAAGSGDTYRGRSLCLSWRPGNQDVFRLPYLNIRTMRMQYTKSGQYLHGEDGFNQNAYLVEPDDLALAVRFECAPGPTDVRDYQGIPWV
ncbi:hypothetical protein N656DRAFT_353759 [Canariomyces notabilis]|uniref:Uncharacterized protein n=1 Tax=Canariomyces notabilis TaxID=2074819 RepID=A0AAN6QF65_9PEZI|nr:hypothetical protein N656DRAFT_353759 [Canariomyces arenarius]